MGKDEFNSEQADSGNITKLLERLQSPLGPKMAKIMERLHSPLAPQMAKVMEQLRSPLDLQTAKVLEQFRSPLDIQTAKVLEQFRSPLDIQMAKALERLRSPLMDLQLEKVMEQYRTTLEHSRLGKLFQNSYFKAGSALANLSVEVLLKELESRRPEFEGEPNSDQERSAQHIKVEGHAAVSVTATGEARVDKADAVKSQDLSLLPTWLIRFVLHLLLSSIQLAAQWEDIRASVVDLNARLPQTESPSKIRNFIRKELAGKPGDVRLVTGSDVNFRFDPSWKSEVILKLPKNAIVVVQGKEDRTWLLVSYEVKGYWIDGYVSTKYLKRVRRD